MHACLYPRTRPNTNPTPRPYPDPQLLKARDMMYELITNCIPADVILVTLTRELLKVMAEDDLKHEVMHWAAYYENRIKAGTKEIFHLEAFVAKFMSLYKKWIVSSFDFF